MGKPSLAQKDLYERINYLYQACNTVLEHTPKNRQLANFYGHVLSNVAKRGVLKIDPSIKRTICKSCNALLIPGLTSTFRIRGKRQRHIVITCIQCKTLKRFVCNPEHKLWSEQITETKDEPRPDAPTATTDLQGQSKKCKQITQTKGEQKPDAPATIANLPGQSKESKA